MDAVVQRLHSQPVVCEARTDNNLLLVFVIPDGVSVRLSDRLKLGPLQLDSLVQVQNVTQKQSFSVYLQSGNVHDLDIPARHGGSRTPSPERLDGA